MKPKTTTKAVKTPAQTPPLKAEAPKVPPKVEISAKVKQQVAKEDKKFTELVIKEIMVQKQVSRERAIQILESYK